MMYAFTDEQEELRVLVREFVARVSPESEVRRLMEAVGMPAAIASTMPA